MVVDDAVDVLVIVDAVVGDPVVTVGGVSSVDDVLVSGVSVMIVVVVDGDDDDVADSVVMVDVGVALEVAVVVLPPDVVVDVRTDDNVLPVRDDSVKFVIIVTGGNAAHRLPSLRQRPLRPQKLSFVMQAERKPPQSPAQQMHQRGAPFTIP